MILNIVNFFLGLENTGNGNNPGDSSQDIKDLDNLLAPLPSQMELPFTCHHCGVGCSHKGKQIKTEKTFLLQKWENYMLLFKSCHCYF